MGGSDYLPEQKVQLEDLEFEPYHPGKDVHAFDCGDEGLNEFLRNPAEVNYYQEEDLGRTTLVYCHGALVAFYTLSHDKLQAKYVDRRKLSNQVHHRQVEKIVDYPSIKIGRFAVDKNWQNKGIGAILMKHIVGLAFSQHGHFGVRLLILEAYPSAQPFYARFGFQFTELKKGERNKRNRTMFFDLHSVRDVV